MKPQDSRGTEREDESIGKNISSQPQVQGRA
jgi:hypothetical protein